MDPKKPDPDKMKKIIETQNRKEIYNRIKSSDKKSDFISSWRDHVFNRDIISSYSTVVDNKLYQFLPKEDCVFLPFMEVFPDHVDNFIIHWNDKTKEEIYRHNLKYIEMVSWLTKEEQENGL